MDDQFAQEAMLRLPPAQATLQIWRWIATDDLLAEAFDEHRGRSYERVICFATVVQLMADAAMVRARLHQLLHKQWKTRWSKAPPRRNRPPKRGNGPQPGQHYGRHASVHRILTRRKPEG